MSRKGENVSLRTIKRLEASDYGWRSTMLKSLLTVDHREKKLQWTKENINHDFSIIIFSDEASFWVWIHRFHAWLLRGQPFLQRMVKYPLKIHICFCKRGFGVVHVFTGNASVANVYKILIMICREAVSPQLAEILLIKYCKKTMIRNIEITYVHSQKCESNIVTMD